MLVVAEEVALHCHRSRQSVHFFQRAQGPDVLRWHPMEHPIVRPFAFLLPQGPTRYYMIVIEEFKLL